MRARVFVAACAVAVTTTAVTGCSGPSPSSGAPATASGSASPERSAGLPGRTRWQADVRRAMAGSEAYLRQRADRADGERLGVNLDIDNTALASEYDFGAPVPDVLAFARYARSRGIAVLFNSARAEDGDARSKAEQELTAAGYPVTELCLRADGEDVAGGKERCRRHFRDEGYTLVANVGNNTSDFEGGGYERAFRLPNYGRLS